MREVFKDPALAARFDRDGYIILPLLNKEQISFVQSLYHTFPNDINNTFDSSSFQEDTAAKTALNQQINQRVQASINEIFKDYKALGSSFLTKRSGDDSIMPLHQDWTVVDENKYASITCWIPLIDTTPSNGAIQVIPGSHKFSKALRSPSLSVSFENCYTELLPFLETLNLKAGEAFIFNHALMHASHKNQSGKDRVALTYGLTHKDAPLFMYYNSDGNVTKYTMPDNMFIEYHKIRFEPQLGEPIESFEYNVPLLSFATFKHLLNRYKTSKKMKALFKDESHQEFFNLNGFLKLPVLNAEQVEALKSLYTELNLNDEMGYGFHVGMDNRDKSLVAHMVESIKNICVPSVEDYLNETQLFTASFVVKEPNPQGVVPPHQDWSFVEDEEEYCSVTCWIPLQDVTIDNGCIGVIKGSNHFFKNHRPSPSPQVDTPLKEHMFTIFPFLDLIEMKAGEALFFNNKTIHASPPNTTDQPRLAIGLGFTQKEAKICHYNLKAGTEDTLLKYQIDADFFLKYDNAQLSRMYDESKLIEGYEVIDEVPYEIDKLSSEDFTQLMQTAGNSYNAPLVGKMAKLFNYRPDGSKKEDSQPEPEEPKKEGSQVQELDSPPLWKVYTPLNIVREIKSRITGK